MILFLLLKGKIKILDKDFKQRIHILRFLERKVITYSVPCHYNFYLTESFSG